MVAWNAGPTTLIEKGDGIDWTHHSIREDRDYTLDLDIKFITLTSQSTKQKLIYHCKVGKPLTSSGNIIEVDLQLEAKAKGLGLEDIHPAPSWPIEIILCQKIETPFVKKNKRTYRSGLISSFCLMHLLRGLDSKSGKWVLFAFTKPCLDTLKCEESSQFEILIPVWKLDRLEIELIFPFYFLS